MTADSKKHRTREWERERRRERELYLTVRSHHTVRGRRLGVRRALGTRRTLWHCTKTKRQGQRQGEGECEGWGEWRKENWETAVMKRDTDRRSWVTAGPEDSQRARTKACCKTTTTTKQKKMYKNKTLIFLYPKMVREEKGGGGRDSVRERGSREEQANDLALNERKQSETWRGCVLFCLSVMTLRSLLHALCYRC